ncbi:FEKKY domain-containing protein [Joostella sp. CR20]|uniref:FEKKY domain-containing protein n=1 Tax=Joostella sp. CR20 TaxID=2804312 RepID=UPI00313E2515
MKKLFFTLTLLLFTSIIFATEIVATVSFQNQTNKNFSSGAFTIISLNQTIKVTSTESFKITLPKKGKYQFNFISDDFITHTVYPTRINNRQHSITIILMDKTSLSKNLNTENTQSFEQQIAEGSVNFIMFGIDNSIPEEYIVFKNKYGIGLEKENCVVDPFSIKRVTENNKMISNFLNEKYGTKWQKELKTKPFGI